MKQSFTPIVKIAFIVLFTGVGILALTANTDILPTVAVPISIILMFGGAGTLSLFWKPRKIVEEKEVLSYTCAKCNKPLTPSEVYLSEGKNIPQNRRCKTCYFEETKPKETGAS